MRIWPDTHGRVLVVGAGPSAAALGDLLTGWGWCVETLPAPRGVLRRVHDQTTDVVLLAPHAAADGYLELCRQIKLDQRTALVPVIVVMPPEHVALQEAVLQADADDCFSASAGAAEIRTRLAGALRLKKAAESLEDATAVLTSLANAIEGRDAYTRGHVERVAAYSVSVGRRLGLGDEDLHTLRIGSVIHDIGKVAVPDQILNKPGPLTAEEIVIIRRHPVVGYDVLQPLRTLRNALPIVRWHHERPNGRGYPDGIGGKDLPLLPRLVAVTDVFDALTTARPYRPPLRPEQYRSILDRSVAEGDLDREIVGQLLEWLAQSTPVAAAPSPARC
ncbi:MAG: HD domain-containing phosphohydrolase [Planctomycetota bacterium]